MGSPHEIPNEQLRREHLPTPDDDQFAWIPQRCTHGLSADGIFLVDEMRPSLWHPPPGRV